MTAPCGLHHVELWVPDLTRAVESWGWLFDALGWQPYQHWDAGGPDHYAAYLVDRDGFEVELVAG